VFKEIPKDKDVEHWAINVLTLDDLVLLELAENRYSVEVCHETLKQCFHIKGCQCPSV